MIQEVLSRQIPATIYPEHYQADLLDQLYDAKKPLGVLALHLQLLGDFQLVSGDKPVVGIDMPRLQSLLAYLALHRKSPQSRSQLAYLLWPDSTEAQAHTNLRNLIHKLRQVLPGAGSWLCVERQTLSWQPNVPWTLDVIDFEWAIIRAEQAQQAGDLAAERLALENVVKLYHGDLLPGCYEKWVLTERERLQQLHLMALERLVVVLERVRDYHAAINAAHHLLRLDPLHESAYCHLMRMYAASGNRAAAIRTYATCTRILERELGIGPAIATREAYQRLIQVEEAWIGPRVARQKSQIVHMYKHYLNRVK